MTMQTSDSESQTAAKAATRPVPAHVCVCICTFQRPELLSRLLSRLLELQRGDNRLTLSCVVIDNDDQGSAAKVVSAFQKSGGVNCSYQCEPERNFAVVRNRAVRAARSDYIAFIDDDEIPEKDWLLRLMETCERCQSDGALGPVRPYFEQKPPRWLENSGLCHRPVHPTGMAMDWQQTRTGNVLLKRDIFESGGIWFDPAYRTGGEDVDFFKRAIAAGWKFVWCEEAPAYELVPPGRMRLGYYARRALLQGAISFKYGASQNRLSSRARVGLKSLVALVLYTLVLPFTLFGGTGPFVRILVKWCHHLGRFSACCGRPVLRERKL